MTTISAMLRNSYYLFIWDSYEHWKSWEYEKFSGQRILKFYRKVWEFFGESVKIQKIGSENDVIIRHKQYKNTCL